MNFANLLSHAILSAPFPSGVVAAALRLACRYRQKSKRSTVGGVIGGTGDDE